MKHEDFEINFGQEPDGRIWVETRVGTEITRTVVDTEKEAAAIIKQHVEDRRRADPEGEAKAKAEWDKIRARFGRTRH